MLDVAILRRVRPRGALEGPLFGLVGHFFTLFNDVMTSRPQRGSRPHQLLRVGVPRILKNLQRRTRFHNAPLTHHDDPIRALGRQTKVVSDQHHRCSQFVGK